MVRSTGLGVMEPTWKSSPAVGRLGLEASDFSSGPPSFPRDKVEMQEFSGNGVSGGSNKVTGAEG